MEFEHIDHKGGEHKGIEKSLSLFKKKPVFMIGGVIVVILFIFVFRGKGSNTADQTATDTAASGLDGYPTVGASGSGGATGVSSDQLDQIQSSILSNITPQLNSLVSDTFEGHLQADQSKFDSFTQSFGDQYAKDLASTTASIGKVTDAVAGVTTAVDHLASTVQTNQNTQKATDAAQNKQIAAAKTTPTVTSKVTAVKAPTTVSAAQNLINKIDGTNTKTSSVVDYLKSAGVGSSMADRKKYAAELGIKNYTGTAAQNTAMLQKLKSDGK